MGSLSTDVDISDITYRNIYTWNSNQMYMVKSNGGSGNVENLLLENFIGKNHSQVSPEQKLTTQATETPTPSISTEPGVA